MSPIDCIWRPRLDGAGVICIACRRPHRRASRRNCTGPLIPDAEMTEAARELGLWGKLSNYRATVTEWIRAGRPRRTDAEVERILRVFCRAPCKHHHKGHCRACGCRVNASQWAMANKLRMDLPGLCAAGHF